MMKSDRQIDVNSAFSKAIEKKSANNFSWDNDIEPPANDRYKKPQLQVNVASQNEVTFWEDGAVAGLGSSDEEENNQGGQTSNSHVATST